LIAIDPRVLKKTIMIAKPIADSEAATVKIKRENNSPMISSKYIEKNKKFKFIDNSISSIHRITNIRFCRFIKIPNKPIQNKKKCIKKWFKIFIKYYI
jgi:hypothetical protein